MNVTLRNERVILTSKKIDKSVSESETVRNEQSPPIPTKYGKSAFLNSKQFKEHKHLLNLLLDNNRLYTISEVENLLKNIKRKR